MRIGIVGAGPAGLYFALLMKRRHNAYDVRVIERNPPDSTFGFGLVFSEKALRFLERDDPGTFAALTSEMEAWPDQRIVHRDEVVNIDGNGFSAIGRLKLLQLLHGFCREAGVHIDFQREIDPLDTFAGCDLMVGADGINSRVRDLHADALRPRIESLKNMFVWYGTKQVFDTLTLTFRANRHGSFVAHHYRYAPDMSTFIVECDPETWRRAGLRHMDDAASRAYCERLFAPDLDGHSLISNNSSWRRFALVTNENWSTGNVVILGDALRSVHFSIGSGTRLAMEDAVALYQAFNEAGAASATWADVPGALARFEAARRPIVEKLQAAAAKSSGWYEKLAGKMGLEAYQLAYDYMTRSGRVTHARLKEMAPRFTASFETRFGVPEHA
ncbi:MAG: FAD-dependent monooxygenase [Rhodospirillales bacterium]|nr:FAD-dependent monooxygenase [Rhodospirillales bacterium]